MSVAERSRPIGLGSASQLIRSIDRAVRKMEVRDGIERAAVTSGREVASAERNECGLDRLVGVPVGVGEPGEHALGRRGQQLALVRAESPSCNVVSSQAR